MHGDPQFSESAFSSSTGPDTATAVQDGKAVVDGGATKTVAASRPWNVDHAERRVFAFGNSSQDQCLSMAQIKVTAGVQAT